jgi:hypothetical protein
MSDVGPRTNIVLSLGLLVGCALGWLGTDTFEAALLVDPLGPAYYPRFVLLCIAALSVVLLVASIRGLRRKAADEEPAPQEPLPASLAAIDGVGTQAVAEDVETLPPVYYPRLLSVLALSLGYALLLEGIGYFLSTVLYVIALLVMVRVRNPLRIAGCALGLPLVFQSLFQKLLGIPLPGGLLDKLPFNIPF